MAAFRYIAADVDAAVAFYTTLLDFELEEQFGPAMAIVRRDDLALWLAPGAKHNMSRAVQTEEYDRRVVAHLAKCLGQTVAEPVKDTACRSGQCQVSTAVVSEFT